MRSVSCTRPARSVAGSALLGALAMLTVLVLSVGACGNDDKTTAPGPTVTVTVGPSGTGAASGSPSPKATTVVKKQLAIAAASGPNANGLSAVSSSGAVKQLVAPKGGAIRELAWSPDAAHLAYVQAKSPTTNDGVLVVYDLAAASAKPVLVGGSKPYAVAGYTWVGPTQLMVAAFKAKGATYHANAALYLCDIAAGTGKPVVDSGGKAVKGVWPSASADQTAIAFVRYGKQTGSDLVQDLMLYDADTLSIKKVAHGMVATDYDSDAFASPQISADGSLIYTVAHGSDIGFSCTVYRVNGSKAYKSPPLVYPTNGSWDAGSGRLAFGGGPGTGSALVDGVNIWVPGSSSADLIVSGKKIYVSSLDWTPKGKQVVYCSSKNYPSADLWVVNADGSNPHLLLKNGSAPACAEAPISFK
jgi:Tol biopolymer transport system component